MLKTFYSKNKGVSCGDCTAEIDTTGSTYPGIRGKCRGFWIRTVEVNGNIFFCYTVKKVI